MLELVQWFNDRDRLLGLIVFTIVFFMGLSWVAKAVRGGDE